MAKFSRSTPTVVTYPRNLVPWSSLTCSMLSYRTCRSARQSLRQQGNAHQQIEEEGAAPFVSGLPTPRRKGYWPQRGYGAPRSRSASTVFRTDNAGATAAQVGESLLAQRFRCCVLPSHIRSPNVRLSQILVRESNCLGTARCGLALTSAINISN